MERIIASIEAIAAQHPAEGYLILGLCAFLENIFPPLPGDTVTIFGAYLVGRGALAVWPVVWATFIGSTAGFMTLYALGRTLGRSALLRLKWVRKSEGRIESAERLVRRYGIFLVLANRFMPWLRSVVSIALGLLRMPFWYVLPAAAVSVFLWNALLIWGGLVAGRNWERVVEIVNQYNRVFGIALVVGGIFGVLGWRWLRGRRTRSARVTGARQAEADGTKEAGE